MINLRVLCSKLITVIKKKKKIDNTFYNKYRYILIMFFLINKIGLNYFIEIGL